MTEYEAREYEMVEAIPHESDAYYLCNGETMESEDVLKRLKEHEAAREALHAPVTTVGRPVDSIAIMAERIQRIWQALGGGEG